MWKINCINDFGVIFDPKHISADISWTIRPIAKSFYIMKSLVVGEDNKNYGEMCSTDKKNISGLSAAGSKKTPLCYSKVKGCLTN